MKNIFIKKNKITFKSKKQITRYFAKTANTFKLIAITIDTVETEIIEQNKRFLELLLPLNNRPIG